MTSKQATADYSKALTLSAPADARLAVSRIAARLSYTVDSFDTAEHCYCSVYVDDADGSEADHCLFDSIDAGVETKLAVQDTLVGTKEVIFNLLKDGAAHTFYFFFWIDKANNAVISAVELWEGVGTCSTGYPEIMRLTHTGFISCGVSFSRVGSGTASIKGYPQNWNYYLGDAYETSFLVYGYYRFMGHGTVASDLNYITYSAINLRSEQ